MRRNPEKQIELKIREALKRKGWYVKKTHGSGFSKDWPDLFVSHPAWGSGWVEVKVPKGEMSEGQIKEFLEMQKFGVKIWVLTSPEQVNLLYNSPNFIQYLMLQRGNAL